MELGKTKLGEMTVGEFKALINVEMRDRMMELLQDFENFIPDPEDGWTVQPQVWVKLRKFINGQAYEDAESEESE